MRKRQRQPAAQTLSGYDRATAAILALGCVIVPLVFKSSTLDPFREPKEIAFRLTAILTLVAAVFFATARGRRFSELWSNIPKRELIVCGAVLGWTIVTTITSTNRLLSVSSIVTVAATVSLYLTARRLVPSFPMRALDICLLPAIVNAIVIILQEAHIWNPFTFPGRVGGHEQSTAFTGHPNDAGVYLLGATVAAVVAVTVARGTWRVLYALVAMLLLTGILASATRTAMIAFAISMFAFALYRPWKQSLVIFGTILIIAATAFATSALLRRQFQVLIDAARQQRYDRLTSERLMPFLTAISMFRKHPLMGVGPGCFRYHYMDERLALTSELPPNLTRSFPQNFGETHNDHLQIAAETGLPGYLLFIAALVIVALPAFRKLEPHAPVKTAYARSLAIPLVVAFAVVALAQFPLQIAATRMMFLSFAVLATGWSPPDV
jgi:O-antigen ligase